jgi:hypothetical protein
MMNNGNDIMDHLHDANVLFDENINGLSKKKKGKISRRTKKKKWKRRKRKQ